MSGLLARARDTGDKLLDSRYANNFLFVHKQYVLHSSDGNTGNSCVKCIQYIFKMYRSSYVTGSRAHRGTHFQKPGSDN